MKKSLFLLILLFVFGNNLLTYAQEDVPKEVLLTTLNDVAHLKLENDQVSKLMDYNEGFVDKVYEVLENDQEDKRKKEELDALSYTRQVDLHEFLSKHETKKYLNYMEDELKPLTHKNKLLKHISKTQKIKH